MHLHTHLPDWRYREGKKKKKRIIFTAIAAQTMQFIQLVYNRLGHLIANLYFLQ